MIRPANSELRDLVLMARITAALAGARNATRIWGAERGGGARGAGDGRLGSGRESATPPARPF
jgi:hypothetical protein